MARGNARIALVLMLLCVAMGNAALADATTVSLRPDRTAPQPIGTPVRWTASAGGGTEPYSFKWWLYDGVSWKVLRDWSTNTSYDWSPMLANSSYRVGVWVRSAGESADLDEANEGANFAITVATVASSPVNAVTLTADRTAPATPGSTITWTAQPTGGVAPLSFKWWLYDGLRWQLLRDWSASASYAWTPTVANSAYRMGVWVKSAGNTSDTDEANQGTNFAVVAPAAPGPVASLTLVPDRPAPQSAGTAITFTATPAGGVAPYAYKWWLYDGVRWSILRDWTSSASFVWSPVSANSSYKLGVWVRSAGNSSDTDESNLSVPFPIGQAATITAVTLSPDRTAPQPAGTTVRWTASATGGVAPVSYKWWVYDGLQWTVLADWSTSAVVPWTPARPNEAFKIGVWARSANNSTDVDEVNLSQPFPVRGGARDCLESLEPSVVTVGSGGGSGSVRIVPAEAACGWDVTSQATWVSVTSPQSGTGDGSVTFTVSPNVDQVSRTGFVMIGAKALSISQAGLSSSGGCTYAVFPTVLDVGFGNENATVAVTAPSGCAWSASVSGFVHATPGGGTGSGTLKVSIENNTASDPRGTVLMVAGRAVTITQAGRSANTEGCTYAVSPSEAAFDFHAGSGAAEVTAPAGCAWTATTASAFVHFTGGTSGSGSGTVTYAIDANGAGTPRSALLMVGGEPVTLAQRAAMLPEPCVATLSALSATVSYAGGSGAVAVSTAGGCSWNVVSNTEWIHVTDSSGPSGSGNVWYSVDANGGSARAGTLVIAGQTFTISQREPPVSASAEDITWVTQPDPERVGQCEGNCGAGCGTFFNPCGGPHYWEHTVLSAPQYVGDDWEPVCSGGFSWFVVRPRYSALARWTYHGLRSSKCEEHDVTCRNLDFIPFLPLDKALCLATAALVGLNGLNYCEDAQPFDWSYDIVDIGHGAPVAFIDGAPSCD